MLIRLIFVYATHVIG